MGHVMAKSLDCHRMVRRGRGKDWMERSGQRQLDECAFILFGETALVSRYIQDQWRTALGLTAWSDNMRRPVSALAA